jgi:hypothetical protein
MAIRVELNLRLANSPGALSAVCQLLSDERVNVMAMALESGGQLRLVVDNHVHALGVLRERHHQVAARDVLFAPMPHGPGALASVLKLAADAGVNVEYAYGGAPEMGTSAAVVLGVDDARRASAATGI